MIDPHRLRIFRAVVAEGSITGAAAALGYTPSAVSQHIAGLQRETGLTLIERHGRGIVPTDAGTAVAAAASPVFEGLSELDGLIADLRGGRAGTFRVSYFASAGAAWMPAVIATIGAEFPDIRLDLRLVELADADTTPPDIEIYVDGAASTAMTDYEHAPLVTEEYLAILPHDAERAQQPSITLRELGTLPWIDNDVARGPCREGVLRACAAAGFAPLFRVETHDYTTAIRFVAAGVGVTVVPALAMIELPPDVIAVRITDPTPQRHISLRRHHRTRGNAVAERAVDLIRAQVARTHGTPQ